MAGAYYTAVLPSCTVKTSPVPVAGSSMWCPDAPTGYTNYHVEDWNRLFPNYAVPVPTFCRRQQVPPPPSPAPPATSPTPPGATTPPTITPKPPQEGEPPVKPITGDPPSPPQEGCEPAMSVPEGGHATSSKFVNSGGADLTAFGYSVLDQMGQPLAMGMTPLATYADNIPAFTHSPEMEIVSHPSGHQVNSLHEGTGPGLLVLHPPELQDYMLHGSGTNEDSRWPTEMSTSTLLLLNSERADASTGDEARTLFAFGEALKGTVKPGNGIYFDFDPATGVLNIQHTDASGGDATVANGVTIDGSPIGGGSHPDPHLLGDGSIAAPTYSFTSNPAAGMWLDAAATPDEVIINSVDGTDVFRIANSGATVNGRLLITEQVVFTGAYSGAAGNDVAIGAVGRARFTSGATLTGMTGGVDGRVLVIENATGGTLTVSHDATSTAANRFYCPGSTDLSVPANGSIVVCYSGTDSRWRVASIASGGGSTVRSVSAQFGGPGGSISAGDTVWARVPYSGTITKVSLLADATGSIVVDIWKDTYANYPPTVADTITAAAKPTLSSANKSEDSTLTGWTTTVTAGDVLKFNVDSVSGLTQVSLLLEITS